MFALFVYKMILVAERKGRERKFGQFFALLECRWSVFPEQSALQPAVCMGGGNFLENVQDV